MTEKLLFMSRLCAFMTSHAMSLNMTEVAWNYFL